MFYDEQLQNKSNTQKKKRMLGKLELFTDLIWAKFSALFVYVECLGKGLRKFCLL